MILALSRQKTIHALQDDFSNYYPFLKLEFYKLNDQDSSFKIRKHLLHSVTLASAGLIHDGELELHEGMSVGDLEKLFLEKFGLEVQVSRKAGTSWLETTLTDNWSLQKQNEHGREMSIFIPRYL